MAGKTNPGLEEFDFDFELDVNPGLNSDVDLEGIDYGKTADGSASGHGTVKSSARHTLTVRITKERHKKLRSYAIDHDYTSFTAVVEELLDGMEELLRNDENKFEGQRGEDLRRLSASISSFRYKKLRRYASDHEVTIVEVISRLIDTLQ